MSVNNKYCRSLKNIIRGKYMRIDANVTNVSDQCKMHGGARRLGKHASSATTLVVGGWWGKGNHWSNDVQWFA